MFQCLPLPAFPGWAPGGSAEPWAPSGPPKWEEQEAPGGAARVKLETLGIVV